MRSKRSMSAGKRFAVTMIMSVAAFVLLTGQFCPFGGGGEQAQAPAPAPAPAPVATGDDDAASAPAQIDTSNLEVKTLTLTDNNGNARAVLATDDSGAPAFTFFDANGGTRSRLSLDGNGNPFIDLYNSKGEILSSYWIENDEPFLTYRAKDGKTVTIIPKDTVAPPRPVAAATTTRPVVNRPTTKPAANDYTVYVINNRPNYHLRTCDRLEGHGKHPMNRSDALANGYQPCKECRPDSPGAGGASAAPARPAAAGAIVPNEKRGGSSAAGEQTVFVINGRPNYHLRSCDRLEGKGKHPMAISDAIANGYQPCKECRPPR